MPEPDLRTARTAYDAVAARYADQFRNMLDDRPVERGLLAAFAEMVRRGPAGPVVDLGCGPGHIAAHLHGLGLPMLGVDQSAEMLAIGRARYPEVRFALGSITSLGLADSSCRGALSRSSVIHLPPALLPSALGEFARVLAPGGWLLLSFSATDGPEPPYEYFDHRVAGAYRWWPDHVVSLLQAAGVTETARLIEKPEPDDRRQFRVASILARKGPATGHHGDEAIRPNQRANGAGRLEQPRRRQNRISVSARTPAGQRQLAQSRMKSRATFGKIRPCLHRSSDATSQQRAH